MTLYEELVAWAKRDKVTTDELREVVARFDRLARDHADGHHLLPNPDCGPCQEARRM